MGSRTPLRRVSQGSLFALSRSGTSPDAPTGLGFLQPALTEFADETDTLLSNIDTMINLNESLAKFNEAFASWLYILNMNALTIDWPQAPTEASFKLAKQRTEDALAALEAEKRQAVPPRAEPVLDKTTATETTAERDDTRPPAKPAPAAKKKKKLNQLTAKERKERNLEIDRVVSALPIEFRGTDPDLRRNLETIIEKLMDAPGRVSKMTDLIGPDLGQARVNKCLLALVKRKAVSRDNSTGVVLYHYHGIPAS